MSAYQWTALGSCLIRADTWNPLRAKDGEAFRYIDLSAVDQDTKAITEAREIACAEAPSRARQLVAAGDVLVSTVRPNLNGVARVPNDLDGATASTGFCVLRPDPKKLDGNYLFQWVKSSGFVDDMVNKATGASYPAVSDRIIFESLLPLPSIEEQRRIAAILDQAETLRAQRRSALAQLDRLTQAIFLDMFGDPVANPKGWEKMQFASVCATRLGKMLDAKQQTGENSRRYLRNANVQWFRIDVIDLLEMDFDAEARETFRLQSGDLLICEGGEPGRAAIWRGELDDIYYQKALHRGRPNPDLANAEFLVWLLWFLAKKGGLGDHITAATIAHLTGEKLKAMPIPLPPLPLQQTFATRIEAIEALKASHRRALSALDALFAALQQRAFAGEL